MKSVGAVDARPRIPGCETPSLKPKCSCPRNGPGQRFSPLFEQQLESCGSGGSLRTFSTDGLQIQRVVGRDDDENVGLLAWSADNPRMSIACALRDVGSPRNAERSANPCRKL